ncbi:transport permease protein [Nocardioides sp. OK12]|uniref:ABC transporter permease n=1 Tax=Nocardioides sp. OK12 TaxID=2758661 RepID=UPI0021C45B2C|nr:ABC transporter permease [Nocardioides sp. OK12]GHJ61052.1 transport permease protein [Nocardioides sp. OK12]
MTSSAPTGTLGGALRLVDYWATVYRRTWRGSIVTSFVTPLLYVLAMGVLLGGFVEADAEVLEGATTYLAFVVPGMVAATTMTTVVGEVTYPVMAMVKWNKTYYSMTATPLAVPDIVLAHLGFVAFRVTVTAAVFLAVTAPFGVYESLPGVLAALVVQVLLGMAFAAPVYAFAAGLRDETAFALVFRLGMIPMFLFSGAFFPVANLDAPLEALARATPLWHGVDLTRMLVLGVPDWSMVLVHVGYLLALVALGWWWALRRLTRRLAQ